MSGMKGRNPTSEEKRQIEDYKKHVHFGKDASNGIQESSLGLIKLPN
jgi:hypothetical protein